MPKGGHPNSGFRIGNKCACRKDKLSQKEIRRRKKIRSREYRKTHPNLYNSARRRMYYMEAKAKEFKEILWKK